MAGGSDGRLRNTAIPSPPRFARGSRIRHSFSGADARQKSRSWFRTQAMVDAQTCDRERKETCQPKLCASPRRAAETQVARRERPNPTGSEEVGSCYTRQDLV